MDPTECFSDPESRNFQYIFNILQQFHNRVKLFDIRDDEFSVSFSWAVRLSPVSVSTGITLAEIAKETDITKLRRQCIIISYSAHLNENAEILRKLLMKHKCKEIHLLENIENFLNKYAFLTHSHRIKEYPNEIIPQFLYLGSEEQAHNSHIIDSLKITHVVNATMSASNKFQHLKYCRIKVIDQESENIFRYFQKAFEFIERALHENQMGARNVVLVHCAYGVSRSATIVSMYLMRTFGMTVEESVRFVKLHRSKTDPNPGFLRQLEDFHRNKYRFVKSFVE